MNNNLLSSNKQKIYFVLGLIALGVVSRLVPHAANVTAILAISALSGRYINNKWLAAGFPVLALWISDLFLGFHSTMLFVYAAMAVTTLSSAYFLRSKISVIRLGAFSIGGSLFFFVISNLGVWMMDSLYPMTVQGLVSCFVMAIPFFINQVAGDFLYIFTTFGIMEALKSLQYLDGPTASE